MNERILRGTIDNPGASATVTVYDEANDSNSASIKKSRVRFRLFADQAVTVTTIWSDVAAGAQRSTSQVASANAIFDFDLRLAPGFNKVTITTTTAPTVWQIAIETTSTAVKDA